MTDPRLGHLRLVFWGLVLVVVDLKAGGIDWVPDPLGWLLVFVGLLQLRALHVAFDLAAAAGAVGCAVSTLVALDFHAPWLTSADTAATTGLVFATCTGLVRTYPREAVLANAVRWSDLALTLLLLPLTWWSGELGPAVVLVLVILLLDLVAFVFFMVLLWKASQAAREAREIPAPAA